MAAESQKMAEPEAVNDSRPKAECEYCEKEFYPPEGMVVVVFDDKTCIVQSEDCLSGYTSPKVGYFPVAIFRIGDPLPLDKWPARPASAPAAKEEGEHRELASWMKKGSMERLTNEKGEDGKIHARKEMVEAPASAPAAIEGEHSEIPAWMEKGSMERLTNEKGEDGKIHTRKETMKEPSRKRPKKS
jgi:hypothetical protein